MKNILHIVGNRPQFIKLAVLHQELSRSGIAQKIVHSGQHSSPEMSGVFFSELNIPEPDIVLQPLNTGHPDAFIAEITILLQEYFTLHKKSIAFVYGDTNTTLAAAIAAKRSGTLLFHFEAGIRTGDNSMPEEINRVLTDRLANTNYCCTGLNYQTMLAEGYGSSINSRVVQTGDLMYDAFLEIPFAEKNYTTEKNYVACTIHRAANILSREKLSAIVQALNVIHKKIPVIMPLHPHTQKRMAEYALQPAFHILPPLGYPEMKRLLIESAFVITDSGGAAREAFFCKKKSLVIMDRPFWPEIMDAGCSISSVAETAEILQKVDQLSSLAAVFQSPVFGKGDAAKQIAKDISEN